MFRTIIKIICWLLIATILVGGVVYVAGLINLKKSASWSLFNIKKSVRLALSSLTNLDFKDAQKSFENIYTEITGLETQTKKFSLAIFIRQLPETFKNLGQLSAGSIKLVSDLDVLKNNALKWLFSQKGNLLIIQLKNISETISKILPFLNNLKQQASLINYPLGSDFEKIKKDLYQGDQILKTVISWLELSEPQHLVILFQNHSEIRPAGGFLGSFADLTLNRGQIINLEVKDIYDIDGQLKRKIIPPRPLQMITTNWGARDANWFFDFPTSARKVLQLLEESEYFKEKNVKFAGAIAVNPKIITDMLDIIGPIDLPEYATAVNSENFLPTLQREIETGEDNKAGHPKKILQVLMPKLFEKIGQLNEDQKKDFLKKLIDRFANKDIQIYFQDVLIENYLKDFQVTGEVAQLPANFSGDYLAVVNANIGGGKSDLFIKQKIKLEGDINLSGKLKNKLIIKREYQKPNIEDPWYKKDNQDYLQIMTAANANLLSINGEQEKAIKSPVDYQKLNYETDSDIASLEKENVWNKKIFSAWLTAKTGETKTITFQYEIPNVFEIHEAYKISNPFTFIYDKQSGVDSVFEYSISAPVGYQWQESGSPVFKFEIKNTPARLNFKLHLRKTSI